MFSPFYYLYLLKRIASLLIVVNYRQKSLKHKVHAEYEIVWTWITMTRIKSGASERVRLLEQARKAIFGKNRKENHEVGMETEDHRKKVREFSNSSQSIRKKVVFESLLALFVS